MYSIDIFVRLGFVHRFPGWILFVYRSRCSIYELPFVSLRKHEGHFSKGRFESNLRLFDCCIPLQRLHSERKGCNLYKQDLTFNFVTIRKVTNVKVTLM